MLLQSDFAYGKKDRKASWVEEKLGCLQCQLAKLLETQNMLRYVQKLCRTHARKKCGPEKIGSAIACLTSDLYLKETKEREGNPQPCYVTMY
jgi:hypothetical protein